MKDKQLVFLDYTFILDTGETFSHLFEFEKQLSQFFSEHNLEASIMKSMEGSLTKRMMYVSKKADVVEIKEPAQKGRPLTLKGHIKRLSERKLRKPAQDFIKKERKLRK